MAALLGLRGKSLLALLIACLLALVPAILVGWQLLDGIHNRFGQAYARNTTLLNRERIASVVSRELALSKRFMGSDITRQWFLDENNTEKKQRFFREAEGYRQDFGSHAFSLVVLGSHHYYFRDNNDPIAQLPRSTLDPGREYDSWFFNSLRDTQDYNINVNHDVSVNRTMVWFNVLAYDGTRRIGIGGSALDLGEFLDELINTRESGVMPIIVNQEGAIQAHRDKSLIALNSGTGQASAGGHDLFGLLASEDERTAVRQALADAERQPGQAFSLWVTLQGSRQLLAMSYIPELKWHVLTAVDMHAAQVVDRGLLTTLLLMLIALLTMLVIVAAWWVDKLVLKPIRQLQKTAQAMSAGRFDVALPKGRDDEIGQLSEAFGAMADKVRSHTAELESRVRERTLSLEQANKEMAAAHKKIGDSIDYASLIQRAILPSRQLQSSFGDRHAVMWRPRDVVGGDFYIYRAGQRGCLFGVVDCAGHGVPGALMTMLAHAAIDQSIADTGLTDPARILTRLDQIVRAMLQDGDSDSRVATNMDVGLAWIDMDQRRILYAGAKIGLYYSDGDSVEEISGGRRALGDKRIGQYENTEVEMVAGRTFYMTTDGFLDQAGGELGFGFGNSRFVDMLSQYARLPLEQQASAFERTLASYQGSHNQRDDITLLCFRFD